MNMEDFVRGCISCNPRSDPDKAAELLRNAAELGTAILKKRNTPQVDYQQVIDLYNASCGTMPKVTKLTDKRKRSIKACIAQGYTVEDLGNAFQKAAQTPFLTGENERSWRANFDFIIKPDNLLKILEGNYGAAPAAQKSHSYDLDLLVNHAINDVLKYDKEG